MKVTKIMNTINIRMTLVNAKWNLCNPWIRAICDPGN